ncbi:hypothetical protein [Kribbella sp. NBC_00889]|uniref:hypothetical protein n=1 Tax=Kribbella sp. NBC_00889 TaxID=2975974 RepID=UPI003865503C|nr:hypothetical protein OG817_13540 [Kribbella sp. NBC_00889]
MTQQGPLPWATAFAAVVRCVVASGKLLVQRRIHQPREHVGRRLWFADGTRGRVYRETVVDRPPAAEPCVLVVAFLLRGVHGRGHTLFRWESWLNLPLFVGFEGFVSKLWLAHDDHGFYRGVYEWDGPQAAEAYARALWRVLELVSVTGCVRYRVIPDLRCEDLLADAHILDPIEPTGERSWWRLIDAA